MSLIKSYRDLEVYNNAMETCMKIFELSKRFPAEERYSLTDQIRRSSQICMHQSRAGMAQATISRCVPRQIKRC